MVSMNNLTRICGMRTRSRYCSPAMKVWSSGKPRSAPNSKSKLTQAGEWVVQLYRDWGQSEKAAEWQAKLESEKAGATPAPQK
jgi:hypothetical protein